MYEQNDLVLLGTRHVQIELNENELIRSIIVIPRFLYDHFSSNKRLTEDDPLYSVCLNFQSSLEKLLTPSMWDFCKLLLMPTKINHFVNCDDVFLKVDDIAKMLDIGERTVRNRLSSLEKQNILYCYTSKNASINGEGLKKRKLYEFIVNQKPEFISVEQEFEEYKPVNCDKLTATQVSRHSSLYQDRILREIGLPTKRVSKDLIRKNKQLIYYGDQLHQFVPYTSSSSSYVVTSTKFSKGKVNNNTVDGRQVATEYGIVEAVDLQVYYAIEQYLTDYLHKNASHYSQKTFDNTFSVPISTILVYLQRARNSDINVRQVHRAISRLSTAVFELVTPNKDIIPYRYIERAVLLADRAKADRIHTFLATDEDQINPQLDDENNPQLEKALDHMYILTFSRESVSKMFLRETAFVMPKLSLRHDPLLFKIYVLLRNTLSKRSKQIHTFKWPIFLRKVFLSEATPDMLMIKLFDLKSTIEKINDDHVEMKIVSTNLIDLNLWGYELHFDTTSSSVSVSIDHRRFNASLHLNEDAIAPTLPNPLRQLDISYDIDPKLN